MNIVQYLSLQHSFFLEHLSLLEASSNKYSSHICDAAETKKMIFSIANDVKKHAEMEEKYLFPRLRQYLGKRMEPRRVMDFEHLEIYKILAAIEASDDPRTIRVETKKFIEFLRDHIAIEEKVLFPAAVQFLGDAELKKIGQAARIDDEI